MAGLLAFELLKDGRVLAAAARFVHLTLTLRPKLAYAEILPTFEQNSAYALSF